jgi:hypothetical protein
MTLMDAPVFDEARDRRRRKILLGSGGLLLVLLIGWWLAAGRPIDWPWNWNSHLMGRMTANSFLTAVERNDLPAAYGVWVHDKDWQHHPQSSSYSFSRFQDDWSSTSPENEYGAIQRREQAGTSATAGWPILALFPSARGFCKILLKQQEASGGNFSRATSALK